MNSEGLVQQPVLCRPLHVDKNNNITHWKKRKSNDLLQKIQSTLAKIPEIWLLHLPSKVIFVSKNWEMGGGGEGRMTAGSSGSGPLLEMPCVRQRAVIGQSRRICFSRQTERRSSGAQEEVLRYGAAARHPEDHSKEALSGHSPTSPHSDSTTDWPDWLSSGCQRPLTLQSLEPPKRARITIFGVTVIITLI